MTDTIGANKLPECQMLSNRVCNQCHRHWTFEAHLVHLKQLPIYFDGLCVVAQPVVQLCLQLCAGGRGGGSRDRLYPISEKAFKR